MEAGSAFVVADHRQQRVGEAGDVVAAGAGAPVGEESAEAG